MILVLYTILWTLFLPFLFFGAMIHCIFSPKQWKPYLQRFTILLPSKMNSSIWIHAVSVGEVAASKQLVELLLNHQPNPILLTCYTETGFQMAQRLFGDHPITLAFAPYDSPLLVRRFLNRILPRQVLILETEIWPGMVQMAHQRKIPVIMVNGRIYQKDMMNYKRFKCFLQSTFQAYSLFLLQSDIERSRFIELGIPENRLEVMGNLKLDLIPDLNPDKKQILLELLPDHKNRFYLVVPSTHRGEEEVILTAFARLQPRYPNWRLILAPRHPHRRSEVLQQIHRVGLSVQIRSEKESGDETVFLVDTVGELLPLFELATLVLMGGTFNPQVGGHNFLEPAAFGKPILMGPHYHNFEDMVRLFLTEKALKVLERTDTDTLMHTLMQLFDNEEEQQILGIRCANVMKRNQGVALRVVERVLDKDREMNVI